jgi:hypothetical protein
MVQLHQNLPDLADVGLAESPAKEKIRLVLGLLRRTAVEHRESTGRPFYSIRTVARHFNLPSTTVIRLYDQLKVEGVLGSVWGSKTIIEPLQIDRDIRLKAIVGLPVALSSFSVSPGYRRFFRLIQQALWKQRFGCRLIFHDNGFVESANFTEALVDYGVDVVIWLTPPPKAFISVARLKDHGIRTIPIIDGMPLNGDTGYYVSRQNALAEGLAYWRKIGIQSVATISDRQSTSPSVQRMVQTALTDADISFACYEPNVATPHGHQPQTNGAGGIVFTSRQSFVRLANGGIHKLLNLLGQNRVMLLDGEIDLPIGAPANLSFDVIEFDWAVVARCIVSDLVVGRSATHSETQRIFKSRWKPASAEAFTSR